MKNIHSNELDEFKNNYQQRIENIAKSKTEWIKNFVETQKPKKPVKTVGEMYKEIKRNEFISASENDKLYR